MISVFLHSVGSVHAKKMPSQWDEINRKFNIIDGSSLSCGIKSFNFVSLYTQEQIWDVCFVNKKIQKF